MVQMNLTTFDELKDELWGKRGTPEREEMERQLKEEVEACRLGEIIRKARTEQNLTQEELGERVGVQKSQISRLEKGKNPVTLRTLTRVFRALGVTTASIDLGALGNVQLW